MTEKSQDLTEKCQDLTEKMQRFDRTPALDLTESTPTFIHQKCKDLYIKNAEK